MQKQPPFFLVSLGKSLCKDCPCFLVTLFGREMRSTKNVILEIFFPTSPFCYNSINPFKLSWKGYEHWYSWNTIKIVFIFYIKLNCDIFKSIILSAVLIYFFGFLSFTFLHFTFTLTPLPHSNSLKLQLW